MVAGLARADEVVVGDVEPSPGFDEPGRCPVGPLLRLHTVLGRGPRDLVPVLVCPGQEEDVVADLPVPAREGVRIHGRVCVTDVWCVVHVVDRGRYVEAGHRRSVQTRSFAPDRQGSLGIRGLGRSGWDQPDSPLHSRRAPAATSSPRGTTPGRSAPHIAGDRPRPARRWWPGRLL